jgi:uncharacterized protein
MASLLLLLSYGLAVGISLGLTGGGGSVITVPLLVYLVGEPVHAAIPTSLVIVGGTAFSGYLGRMSQANSADGVIVGLFGLLGAVAGRIGSQLFSGRMLLLLFACIMLIASIFMFRSKTYEARDDSKRNWFLVGAVGISIGLLTGFLGIGGGFLIVPGLVLGLGMHMRAAIPTSLLVIAINCASSLIAPLFGQAPGAGLSAGIDWHVALIFLIGGLVGSAAGGALASRLNQLALKRVFALFVFAVGLFIGGSATGLIPLNVK